MSAQLQEPPLVTGKQRKTLAERIREARQAAGLTQLQLAHDTNLSLSLIASLEQGKAADPKLSTLRVIAEALGVSVADLTS